MKVFVDKDLDYIKAQLIERGHEITNDKSEPCDAILCMLKENSSSISNLQNSFRKEGTLIIDCGSKSIDDIEYIINSRVYNSIF